MIFQNLLVLFTFSMPLVEGRKQIFRIPVNFDNRESELHEFTLDTKDLKQFGVSEWDMKKAFAKGDSSGKVSSREFF